MAAEEGHESTRGDPRLRSLPELQGISQREEKADARGRQKERRKSKDEKNKTKKREGKKGATEAEGNMVTTDMSDKRRHRGKKKRRTPTQ